MRLEWKLAYHRIESRNGWAAQVLADRGEGWWSVGIPKFENGSVSTVETPLEV